jgi:hypothetical protein
MAPDTRRGSGTVVIGGKTVSVANAATCDVPYEIANTLQGWINCGKVGPTSSRPTGAGNSEIYLDTTLGKYVFSNGAGLWFDPIGAAFV